MLQGDLAGGAGLGTLPRVPEGAPGPLGGGDLNAEFLGQHPRHRRGTQAPILQPGLGRLPGGVEALELVVEDWMGLAAAVDKSINTPDFRG